MISIIIPSYNSEATIALCLRSLLHQTYTQPYEIIVVDSSTDQTPRIVNSQFPDVTFNHLPQKTGPGNARNIGMQQAQGELFLFIDSDCMAAEDWIEKHVSAHQQPYLAVGGAVLNHALSQNAIGYAGYISEFREFIPSLPRKEVRHIPTCNISYKKIAFDKYGVFADEFYPQEDLVFNHRLCQHSEKILFDPSIRVSHVHRTRLTDYVKHQYKIGRITAHVINAIKLSGSYLIRHRMICFPLIISLPLLKFTRTLFVFLRLQPAVVISNPASVFIFGCGLLNWARGFMSYVYSNNRD